MVPEGWRSGGGYQVGSGTDVQAASKTSGAINPSKRGSRDPDEAFVLERCASMADILLCWALTMGQESFEWNKKPICYPP